MLCVSFIALTAWISVAQTAALHPVRSNARSVNSTSSTPKFDGYLNTTTAVGSDSSIPTYSTVTVVDVDSPSSTATADGDTSITASQPGFNLSPTSSQGGSDATCKTATIPGWSVSCPDVADSVFTAQHSNDYIGEITLNWTLAGLEDALLEAVRYVYDKHIDLLELLEEVPPFSINVYQTTEFSMTAIFSSSYYNSSDYGLLESSVLGKRAAVGNSVVLQYDPSKLANLGYPAVVGYEYVDFQSPDIYMPRDPQYSHDLPGSQYHQRVYFPTIVTQCVDYYIHTLVGQHPELRQKPLSITVGEYRHVDSFHSWAYTYTCFFTSSTFDENQYTSSQDYHLLAILQRTEACDFDTNLVNTPPPCWWTEYGSKQILNDVAATVPESSVNGFFDDFINALGRYANDGKQGYVMNCAILSACVSPNNPPGADAKDKEIGSYMILRAVMYHHKQLEHMDEVFTTAGQWASTLLPGIVAKLQIPQTASKPPGDNSFDFFGFFKLIVGYTPLGKAVKTIGDIESGVGFFTHMFPTPPKKADVKYPQPDLFHVSDMIANTLVLVREAYVDAFEKAIGNSSPQTKKTNFMKLFDYYAPPSILNTTIELYKDSVEIIKPLMLDYVISTTIAASKAALMKLYQGDEQGFYEGTRITDFYVKYNQHSQPGPQSAMFVNMTDNDGTFWMQPIIYHKNDCGDNTFKFSGEGLGDLDHPEQWHFAYRGLANIQQTESYFDPRRAYQASIDCQNARTNGQFPMESNGNKFYPRPGTLDFFTDVKDPGACMTFNIPIISNKDDVAREACRPWSIDHKGAVFVLDNDYYTDLAQTCDNSFFTQWGTKHAFLYSHPIRSFSTLAIWALEKTGLITDLEDVRNDNHQCYP